MTSVDNLPLYLQQQQTKCNTTSFLGSHLSSCLSTPLIAKSPIYPLTAIFFLYKKK